MTQLHLNKAWGHAREEISRVGKSLFDRGYVHATAGNISMRVDDGFLITPTDACLGFLDPTGLDRLDCLLTVLVFLLEDKRFFSTFRSLNSF